MASKDARGFDADMRVSRLRRQAWPSVGSHAQASCAQQDAGRSPRPRARQVVPAGRAGSLAPACAARRRWGCRPGGLAEGGARGPFARAETQRRNRCRLGGSSEPGPRGGMKQGYEVAGAGQAVTSRRGLMAAQLRRGDARQGAPAASAPPRALGTSLGHKCTVAKATRFSLRPAAVRSAMRACSSVSAPERVRKCASARPTRPRCGAGETRAGARKA